MNDKEIRLRCLEMAMEGRAGWNERDILRVAAAYENFTRTGFAEIASGGIQMAAPPPNLSRASPQVDIRL